MFLIPTLHPAPLLACNHFIGFNAQASGVQSTSIPVAQPKPQPVSELVPTFQATIGGKVVDACDARAVHEYLQSGNRFSDWIVSRINEYDFKENQDFVHLASELSEARYGGQNRTDYHITIRMAKELVWG